MGNKKTRFRRTDCAESAVLNLIEISNIFANSQKQYWFQDGGLLGYYRENDFISHDNDIDIGIHINDLDSNLFKNLFDNNFELVLTRGHVDDSLYIKLIKRGINVDIFPYYDINESEFYHCAFNIENNQINYSYKKFGTQRIIFKGVELQAPDDIDYFVRTKYGESWNIPDANWGHIMSPKNATVIKPAISTEESIEIFNKWLQGQI